MEIRYYMGNGRYSTVHDINQPLPVHLRAAESARIAFQTELEEVRQHGPALLEAFERDQGQIIVATDATAYEELAGSDSIAIATRDVKIDGSPKRNIVLNAATYSLHPKQNILAHELAHHVDNHSHCDLGRSERRIGGTLTLDTLSERSALFKLCAQMDLHIDPGKIARMIKNSIAAGYTKEKWNIETFSYAIGAYAKDPEQFDAPLLKHYIEQIALPYVHAELHNKPLAASLSLVGNTHYGRVMGDAWRHEVGNFMEANGPEEREAARAVIKPVLPQVQRAIIDFMDKEVGNARDFVEQMHGPKGKGKFPS